MNKRKAVFSTLVMSLMISNPVIFAATKTTTVAPKATAAVAVNVQKLNIDKLAGVLPTDSREVNDYKKKVILDAIAKLEAANNVKANKILSDAKIASDKILKNAQAQAKKAKTKAAANKLLVNAKTQANKVLATAKTQAAKATTITTDILNKTVNAAKVSTAVATAKIQPTKVNKLPQIKNTGDTKNYGSTGDVKNYGNTSDTKNYGNTGDINNYGNTGDTKNYGNTNDINNYGNTDDTSNYGN